MRLSLFSTPKHKVFNYQPLYYDARKEALQEKIENARREQEKELGSNTDERPYIAGKHIRGKIQKAVYNSRRHPNKPGVMRLVTLCMIAVLLMVIFYASNAFGMLFSLFN